MFIFLLMIFIKNFYCEIIIKFQKNLIFENLLEINLNLDEKNYFIAIDVNSDVFILNENFTKFSFFYEKFVISKCEKNFLNFETKKLKINNLIINNFSFFSFNNNNKIECNFQGFIGFSKNKNQTNFLHQISNEKKIFSLKLISEILGEIKIGNHENEILSNKNKIISIDSNDKKWAGNLQGIFFGEINLKNDSNVFFIDANENNYFQINENFIIETIQNLIISNKKIFNVIKEKLFKNYIKKNQCKIKEKNNFKGIFCNKKIIENKNFIINLIINNSIIKLNKNFLFEKHSNSEFLFIIVESKIIKNFTLGNKILNLFNIIFDQENNKIHLISNEKNKNRIERIRIINEYNSNLNKNYSNNFEFSLFIILFSNIFGIIFLLISNFRQKISISSKLKINF